MSRLKVQKNSLPVIKDEEKPGIKWSGGNLVFELPEDIKATLEKDLEFDYSKLEIEADPSVTDLITHISEQPSIEAYLGTQCAYIRNQIEVWKEVYTSWYSTTSYKHRIDLMEKHKSKFAEKLLDNFMHVNYQVKIYQHRAIIIKLDTKYRHVCSVRDAFLTKGRLLQTLKNLIELNNQTTLGD